MKILCDGHTHTVASGHAYSTVNEMALAASQIGLELLALTDHAPTMPGGPHIYHFYNLKVLPPALFGVRILRGVEANILDEKGTIDMDDEVMEELDWMVASLHQPCFESRGLAGNTNALIQAMDHPRLNVIGHPDDGRYPVDYRALVQAAGEKKVLLEINNSSLMPTSFRLNSRENYITMLEFCAQEGTSVCVNSDAHWHQAVGRFPKAVEVLEQIGFPENLVANASVARLKAYFRAKIRS